MACLLRILFVLAAAALCAPAAGPLPYRFLLVIGDQWKDPSSKLIEAGGEFPVVVGLLKSWGLPFDILRLDQQRFDGYYLLDREGRPRYGAIIWDADAEAAKGKDLRLLTSLVRDQGAGLVALGDTVAVPEVAALAGLQYRSQYRLPDGLAFSGSHFITRGMEGRGKEFPSLEGGYRPGANVEAQSATVLARRGRLPFLTVRGRSVWLDADRQSVQMGQQIVRDLFKRALVHAQGYALYAEYPKSVLLFMDDFGTSDRTYLPYWHYKTLDEKMIREGLIEPLKRHRAVLMQDVVTGYVDRKNRRITSPWTQQVTDEIDGRTLHDYVSAKRGLDAGLREGVFEIQCHGYTHMLPDLDSPPGPFWDAPMDGVATLGWDVEFGDQVRGNDVPAITQRFLMERGLEYIRRDFGVVPLFVINGGGGKSLSYPHHSARLAAEMGFGLGHFNAAWYLGRDLALAITQIANNASWAHNRGLPDIRWSIDAPQFLVFHDRDVSVDIKAAERLLTSLGPGVRYLTANEYSGYLHARAERDAGSGAIALEYDGHYCRYFADHTSTWVLHLSDETRQASGSAPERRTVEIPKGTGRHLVPVLP
ncbi:MAG: hypothetical protein ACE15B_05890 [Bryobacteraceae bacterium]